MDGVFIQGCGWQVSSTPRWCARCSARSSPGLRYAAALFGPGSEVLAFDTERPTDHDWGPRLQVFLGADDAERHAGPVTEMLAERLPSIFRSYPVAFEVTREPGGGPRHRVEVTALGGWLARAARGLTRGPT